ncbi:MULTISPECIES: hypothetical protein [unclassified Rathayibacter]|nr:MULTISPECIES: hypothetical protein [unclassified Rathayibacter]
MNIRSTIGYVSSNLNQLAPRWRQRARADAQKLCAGRGAEPLVAA